jgi:hypothetical protein
LSIQAGKFKSQQKTAERYRFKKEDDQLGYGDPVISEDGKAVGWTGLFKYATSYPVSWTLVIYSSGKIHHFGVGGGMPIAKWRFEERGKRVAFQTETLHGPAREFYEMRDTASGRVIARIGPADAPIKPLPKWSEGLQEK